MRLRAPDRDRDDRGVIAPARSSAVAMAGVDAARPDRGRRRGRRAAVSTAAMSGAIVDEVVGAQCAAPPSAATARPAPARSPSSARPQRDRDARHDDQDDEPDADEHDLRSTGDRRAGLGRRRASRGPCPATRSSSRPGCTPNTTISVASGTRVRTSIGVMSVRWCAEPGQEVGHLAERRPAGTCTAGSPRRGSSRTSRWRRPPG